MPCELQKLRRFSVCPCLTQLVCSLYVLSFRFRSKKGGARLRLEL